MSCACKIEGAYPDVSNHAFAAVKIVGDPYEFKAFHDLQCTEEASHKGVMKTTICGSLIKLLSKIHLLQLVSLFRLQYYLFIFDLMNASSR
jgi:hypothetical protein